MVAPTKQQQTLAGQQMAQVLAPNAPLANPGQPVERTPEGALKITITPEPTPSQYSDDPAKGYDGDSNYTLGHEDLYPENTSVLYDQILKDTQQPEHQGSKGITQLINRFVANYDANIDALKTPTKGHLLYLLQEMDQHLKWSDPTTPTNKKLASWFNDVKRTEGYKKLDRYRDKAYKYRELRDIQRKYEAYKDSKDQQGGVLHQLALQKAGAESAYNNTVGRIANTVARRASEFYHGDDLVEAYNFMGSIIPAFVEAIADTEWEGDEKDRWGWEWLKEVAGKATDPNFNDYMLPIPSQAEMWPGFRIGRNFKPYLEREKFSEFDPGYNPTTEDIDTGELKWYSAAGGLDKAGFHRPKDFSERFAYTAFGIGSAMQVAKAHTNRLAASGRKEYQRRYAENPVDAWNWLQTESFRYSILKPWQLGKLSQPLRNEYRKMAEFGDDFMKMYGFRVEDIGFTGFLLGAMIAQESETIRSSTGLSALVTLSGGPLTLMLPNILKRATGGVNIESMQKATSIHKLFARLQGPMEQPALIKLLEKNMPHVDQFRKVDPKTGNALPLAPAEQLILLDFHRELHLKDPETRQHLIDDLDRTFDQIKLMDKDGEEAIFAALNHFSTSTLIQSLRHFYSRRGPYTAKGTLQKKDLGEVITALEKKHADNEVKIYDNLRKALLKHSGDEYLQTRELIQGLREGLDGIKVKDLDKLDSVLRDLETLTGKNKDRVTKTLIERYINKNYPTLGALITEINTGKWEATDVVGGRARELIDKAGVDMRADINKEWYASPTAKRNFSSDAVYNTIHKIMKSMGGDIDIPIAKFAKMFPPQRVDRTVGWLMKKARRKADYKTIVDTNVLKTFNKKMAKDNPEWVNITPGKLDSYLEKGQRSFKWGEYGKSSGQMVLINMARAKWGKNTSKLGPMPEAEFSVENLMLLRSEFGKMVEDAKQANNGVVPRPAQGLIKIRKGIDASFKQAKLDKDTTRYISRWNKMADTFYRRLGGKLLRSKSGQYTVTDGQVFTNIFNAIRNDPGTTAKLIKDMFPIDADRVAFMRELNEYGRRIVSNKVMTTGLSFINKEVKIPNPEKIRTVFSPQNPTATNPGGEMYTYFPELQAHADSMANRVSGFSTIKKELTDEVENKFKIIELAKKAFIRKKKHDLDIAYKKLYTLLHDTLADNKLNAKTNQSVFDAIVEATDEGGSPAIIQHILESSEVQKAAKENNIDLKKWVRGLVGHQMTERIGAYLIKPTEQGKGIKTSIGEGSIKDITPEKLKKIWYGQKEILRTVHDKKTFREMEASIEFILDMSINIKTFGADFVKEPIAIWTMASLISRAWNVSKGIVSPMFPLLETAPRAMMNNQRMFLTYLFTDPFAIRYLRNMAKDPGRYLREGNIIQLKHMFYIWGANQEKITSGEFPKLDTISTPKEKYVVDEGWGNLTKKIQDTLSTKREVYTPPPANTSFLVPYLNQFKKWVEE